MERSGQVPRVTLSVLMSTRSETMWSIPSEPGQHFSAYAKDSTSAIPAVSGVIKKTETTTRG